MLAGDFVDFLSEGVDVTFLEPLGGKALLGVPFFND